MLTVLGQLPAAIQHLLRAGGGALLLYLAVGAFRQLRRGDGPDTVDSTPRTLRDAVLVNLLNPNPYIGWALVLGPAAIAAWHDHPAQAIAVVGSFYVTMVLMLALFIVLVGTVRFLGSRGQRALLAAAALAMAGLGVYLLITGAGNFGGAASVSE